MDADTLALANMIYGEVGSKGYDTMVKVGSTALNRLEADRPKEFGGTMNEVLTNPNAYYAVQNQNDPYQWASSGKFPNKDEENRYKEAMQVAYGLVSGTIPKTKGQFYFTAKEEAKLKKNKKAFDFSKVKKVDETDDYNFYSY